MDANAWLLLALFIVSVVPRTYDDVQRRTRRDLRVLRGSAFCNVQFTVTAAVLSLLSLLPARGNSGFC